MEPSTETHIINGNGDLGRIRKSRPKKADSLSNIHLSTFDPNNHMIKLLKSKKVETLVGAEKWEKVEIDYLPVAARIFWFSRDHPDWSIVTKAVKLADKAVIMKAFITDPSGRIIAKARKKETEMGFFDYIEKAETGAVGRALAMCGYGTLQAPEFDERDRLADAPVEKARDDS